MTATWHFLKNMLCINFKLKEKTIMNNKLLIATTLITLAFLAGCNKAEEPATTAAPESSTSTTAPATTEAPTAAPATESK